MEFKYKVYLQEEGKNLTPEGKTVDLFKEEKGIKEKVEFSSYEEAVEAAEKHLKGKEYLVYQDNMVPELRNGLEHFYKAKVELTMDTPSGFVAVLKDNTTDRYGVAFINMDTQDVFSKGGYQEKKHSVELAKETLERDNYFTDPSRLRFENPDFVASLKKVDHEKVIEIEM